MTDKEKQAMNALINDLPHYSISEGRRRFIAMDLAMKGYCKVDKDGVFHFDISDEIAKECKAEIDKAYKEGYADGMEVPLKELREQMKNDILCKEEEVRKETIIKVAKWLNGRVNTDLIWFLLREFGVEVEE